MLGIDVKGKTLSPFHDHFVMTSAMCTLFDLGQSDVPVCQNTDRRPFPVSSFFFFFFFFVYFALSIERGMCDELRKVFLNK